MWRVTIWCRGRQRSRGGAGVRRAGGPAEALARRHRRHRRQGDHAGPNDLARKRFSQSRKAASSMTRSKGIPALFSLSITLASVSAPPLAGSDLSSSPSASVTLASTPHDRVRKLTDTYVELGFDSLEAFRLAVIVVEGVDPDRPPIQPMTTCYWIDVTVFWCVDGNFVSKVIHIQRSCWLSLVGGLTMCPAPACTGQRPYLKFALTSGCDSEIGTGCVLIEDGWWTSQSSNCETAPPLLKCEDCFPSSLCTGASWECHDKVGGVPVGCPSCP